LEHVFQRFYTVDKARSRQLGGSGLGLSIVQTIIDKHFGSITVDSELGKGTTFTIILPINMEQFTA
jgi:two-component system, OmpR family, phosphate regulon sensor histidine kinase PhoR